VRQIERADGRRAFGADAAGYADARPPYPERVYEVLRTRCGLGPGTATFEIGPGTGLATERLTAAGASPLVAVEPDPRLADYLERASAGDGATVDVRVGTFEDVDLPAAAFDLGVAATAFHWVERRPGLRKVARLLKPGGWWAMWWTVFGDPSQPDPFHDATVRLLAPVGQGPSAGAGGIWPFALEREERFADLRAGGLFDAIDLDLTRSTLTLDGEGVRGLYGTFSTVTVLEDGARERLLDALVRIAETEFGGRVERRLVTALYTARRTTAPAT